MKMASNNRMEEAGKMEYNRNRPADKKTKTKKVKKVRN